MTFNSVNNPRKGRPKGAVNKNKRSFIETVNAVIEGYYNSDQMTEDLQKMDPAERFKMVASLAEYAFPKLARSEVSTTVNVNIAKKVFLIDGQNFYLDGIAPVGEKPKIIDITPITPKQLP